MRNRELVLLTLPKRLSASFKRPMRKDYVYLRPWSYLLPFHVHDGDASVLLPLFGIAGYEY